MSRGRLGCGDFNDILSLNLRLCTARELRDVGQHCLVDRVSPTVLRLALQPSAHG
jgi:hypothetical protein